MMSMNSGFNEAPPTRKPSTSGCAASSLQFAAVTEPAEKGGMIMNQDNLPASGLIMHKTIA
uniref:TIM n=1 Tax=Arundo donax TaxID=35708 RepID=A0A0A9D7L0_ARUDO